MASAQRDNVKRITDATEDILQHTIALEAVNKDMVDSEEGDLTEEDLKNIAKETMKNKEEVGEAEQAWVNILPKSNLNIFLFFGARFVEKCFL